MKLSLKDSIFAKMRHAKIKVTRQRELIIDILLGEKHPLTAEDIMTKLQKSKEPISCDLVTIYRTLNQFEKINVVQKSFFNDNSAHYCLNDLEHDEHHHHFICKKCHKITEIDMCMMESQNKALEKMGFTDVTHRLEFYGLCPKCS